MRICDSAILLTKLTYLVGSPTHNWYSEISSNILCLAGHHSTSSICTILVDVITYAWAMELASHWLLVLLPIPFVLVDTYHTSYYKRKTFRCACACMYTLELFGQWYNNGSDSLTISKSPIISLSSLRHWCCLSLSLLSLKKSSKFTTEAKMMQTFS